MKALREGDTLVVWRLDQLGRNLQDLVRLVGDLDSYQRHRDAGSRGAQ
ncbi:recombinase family protein [Paraburkholderia madseniana]